MSIIHILTVGTSLMTNDGGGRRDDVQYQNHVNALNKRCDNIAPDAETANLDALMRRKQEILSRLHQLQLENEVSYRPPKYKGPKDRLPQEVSYLWIKAHEPDPERGERQGQAQCYLLASDTNLGKFCAAVIKDFVNEHAELKKHYQVVQWEPVPGVDTSKPAAFEDQGFRNLMDMTHAIIQQHKDAQKIYLNITGGFKGLVPYGTLQGMIYSAGIVFPRVTLCYLFEETKKIIEMPTYPIGLNFHHWHRNATRLRMVLRGQEAFKQKLSAQIENLLYSDVGGKKLFSLGLYLQKEYERQLSEDPLKVYSREIIHGLLPDNLGGEAKALREILDKLVEQVGDLIWIGDKIPDMVDHALKHHQHLLEFAELFLTPIVYKSSEFMTAKERFCLLAGILLHDCGHSLDYFMSESIKTREGREILLFPSDVRDYHHFLTAARLNDPETAKELAWPGRQGFMDQGLDPDLHDAVQAVCLYHRRRTGYDRYTSEEKRINARNHLTDEDLPPLLEYPLTKRLQHKGIDLMKVVAFMRVIDGCDVQSRRAGSQQFVDQKIKILNRDYRTARRRAEDAVALFRASVATCSRANDVAKLEKAIQSTSVTVEGESLTHYFLKDRLRSVRGGCFELLKHSDEQVKCLAQLWLIAAELIDRAEMKFRQHEHYLKHRCIHEVLVFPSAIQPSEKKLEFDVVLFPDPDLKARLNDYIEPERQSEQKKLKRRELIEDEISSEYADVQTYASQHYGLGVCYWWQEQYETRNANPAGRPFYPPP